MEIGHVVIVLFLLRLLSLHLRVLRFTGKIFVAPPLTRLEIVDITIRVVQRELSQLLLQLFYIVFL